MRLLFFRIAVAMIIGWVSGVQFGLAQQPAVQPSLADLLNDDPAAPGRNASTQSSRLNAGRSGTWERPKDGVQSPDLDKAWTQYEADVAKAKESIRTAISKQFNLATTKGDLDSAEKWQAVGEKFDTSGEFPDSAETKAAVSAAVAKIKKSAEALSKVYEEVVKSLTMEQKIPEAKAARGELVALNRGGNPNNPGQGGKGGGRKLPGRPWEDGRNWVSLASTPEEFKSCWVAGDSRGSVFYDAKTGTISIDSPWDLGTLKLPGKWSEFYFEIATAKTSFGRLDIRVNGVTFKLGPAAEKFPQGVPALLKYDPETRAATVYFAGQPVAQATVLDDDWMSSFECVFSSNGGQNAKIQLREVRLLSE